MIAWLSAWEHIHTVKHGGQNWILGELTTQRLEFRQAKAPGSCKAEFQRRGGLQEKSFKILHMSSLESLHTEGQREIRVLKLNTFLGSQTGAFLMFIQEIQWKLRKSHVGLNRPQSKGYSKPTQTNVESARKLQIKSKVYKVAEYQVNVQKSFLFVCTRK